MNRVAAIIVNYNMPERADALAAHIKKYGVWPVDIYLVDNGSDLVPPAQHTTVKLAKNVQTTNGWLAGLKAADRSGKDYFAYWFLITSAEFVSNADPLMSMADLLINDERAVGVHPALTEDSTTAWTHLITRGGDKPRQTFMIDNIASLYRADWFNAIGRFDPGLVYGWGIDIETCYLARKQGKTLWVDEGARMKKVTDIGYTMQRMNMGADERRRLAADNMNAVLTRRYGLNWRAELLGAYRTAEMA